MARVVVYSMAHRGDVFPYVPIATELSQRGHDVTFVVPREFHEVFADEPFRCVHSGTDFSPVALDEHGDFIRRWGMKLGGAPLLRLYFGTFTVPHLDVLFEAVDDQMVDADLLIAHPAASMVGAMSCERRDVPWIVGDLFPMVVPTRVAPPVGFPNLGPLANRAAWRIGRSRLGGPLTMRSDFVNFRRRLGLDTPTNWNAIDDRLSPHHNLALVSPHYIDTPDDWPKRYETVGFTPWRGPDGGRLPSEVEEYLSVGPPPVVVTLGTSGATARPDVFERVAAVLDDLGARGLFLTSNVAITERVRAAIAPDHGVWPFVPLAAVLERARAVVHSGAHGTNALVLTAGLPSVVVPCMFDQLWHAQRHETLGTGIAVRRSRGLGSALDRLLHDPVLADNAALLGSMLRAENGTAAACDAVESFFSARLPTRR